MIPVIHSPRDRDAVTAQLRAVALYCTSLHEIGALRVCRITDTLRHAIHDCDHHVVRRLDAATLRPNDGSRAETPVMHWARHRERGAGHVAESLLYRAGYYLGRHDGQTATTEDHWHAAEVLACVHEVALRRRMRRTRR